jgi:hypothetical protein
MQPPTRDCAGPLSEQQTKRNYACKPRTQKKPAEPSNLVASRVACRQDVEQLQRKGICEVRCACAATVRGRLTHFLSAGFRTSRGSNSTRGATRVPGGLRAYHWTISMQHQQLGQDSRSKSTVPAGRLLDTVLQTAHPTTGSATHPQKKARGCTSR